MSSVKTLSVSFGSILVMFCVMLGWVLAGGGTSASGAVAQPGHVLVPEGGRLDALDEKGQLIGPCPLKHTEVDVRISGHFTRVNVTQRYHNPYDHKIEAVYTFPLSHRSAVDRMTMIIGDRVVKGEVKQRDVARRIYEAARQQGYVASLLEQERPNIFTQSVANIEPGVEVVIEISYVEVLQSVDGRYHFDFPMVVAPRYTPGTPKTAQDQLPEGAVLRRGVILPEPAQIKGGDDAKGLDDAWLRQHALPIDAASKVIDLGARHEQKPRAVFQVAFENGGQEPGVIFDDGVGHVGGRWFICPAPAMPKPGEPFAVNTDEVPDADRVTPMPVKPDQRAGHDISVRVMIDTGGPGIVDLKSGSHDLTTVLPGGVDRDKPQRMVAALKEGRDIPNRDFRLSWGLTSDKIEEAIFTHTGEYGSFKGGFFTMILQPPDRVAEADVRPRELIFVLDSSGSMRGARLAEGSAHEAAKAIISQAVEAMRPNDRFNIISFNNQTDVLWTGPQPNTEANRQRAQQYIDSRVGGGGTAMRPALLRALERDDKGDEDRPMRIVLFVTDGLVSNDAAIIEATRKNADHTRVFTIGMSHAPNRHLLDEMARVGRGAVDYVLPQDDVAPIVQRFVQRIATPVLTDIELSFAGGLAITDMLPSREQMPDLFDVQPLVIHGRYEKAGSGRLTIRGRTGAGAYERVIDLELPERSPNHDTIATLWAREQVGELMRAGGGERMTDADTIARIVALGEAFQIITQHTSFVAVERQRVTVGGEPVLVRVPIEFPKGMSWEGVFGGDGGVAFEVDADLPMDLEDALPGLARREALRESTFGLDRGRADTRSGGRGVGGGGGGQLPPSPARPATAPAALHSRMAGERDASMHNYRGPALLPDELAYDARTQRESNLPLQLRQGVSNPRVQAMLPEGITLSMVLLPKAVDEDRIKALRAILGETGPEQGEKPAPLGRVYHREGNPHVYLVVFSPLAQLIDSDVNALAKDGLADEGRAVILDRIAQKLREAAPAVRADLEIRRVLDETLLAQALAYRDAEDDAARQTAGAKRHAVTVLLTDVEAGTLKALSSLGLRSLGQSTTGSFVIGEVETAKLQALALHPSVRRVEVRQD